MFAISINQVGGKMLSLRKNYTDEQMRNKIQGYFCNIQFRTITFRCILLHFLYSAIRIFYGMRKEYKQENIAIQLSEFSTIQLKQIQVCKIILRKDMIFRRIRIVGYLQIYQNVEQLCLENTIYRVSKSNPINIDVQIFFIHC